MHKKSVSVTVTLSITIPWLQSWEIGPKTIQNIIRAYVSEVAGTASKIIFYTTKATNEHTVCVMVGGYRILWTM